MARSPQQRNTLIETNKPFLLFKVVATAILSICVLLLWIFWQFGAFDPPDVVPVKFNSAGWKQAEPIGGGRTVRSQMVDDLIASNILNRMDRGGVEALLGPSIDDLQSAGISPEWGLAYRLGRERLGQFSLDDEFLVIRFDANGKVIAYRTVVN